MAYLLWKYAPLVHNLAELCELLLKPGGRLNWSVIPDHLSLLPIALRAVQTLLAHQAAYLDHPL